MNTIFIFKSWIIKTVLLEEWCGINVSLGCTCISEMIDRDECSNIIFTGTYIVGTRIFY